jgi:hypothetical protein
VLFEEHKAVDYIFVHPGDRTRHDSANSPDSQQRVADASAASDKLRASNEVKYTQGELNAINSVLQVSLSTLLKLRRTGQSGVDIDSRSTHAYI